MRIQTATAGKSTVSYYCKRCRRRHTHGCLGLRRSHCPKQRGTILLVDREGNGIEDALNGLEQLDPLEAGRAAFEVIEAIEQRWPGTLKRWAERRAA